MNAQAVPHRARSFRTRRLFKAVRAFVRAEQGATAVEFALVALPFFGMLMVTIQFALVIWCTQIYEVAVASASRQIYTGQFQSSAATAGVTSVADLQARFKTLVCTAAQNSFDCSNQLSVDVRTFSGFSTATVASPNQNGVYNTTGYSYQNATGNMIVVVRASMQLPNYAGMFSPATSLANGNQLIMATAAFRAEPF
jgi:Flp pilus assembly protein TadG